MTATAEAPVVRTAGPAGIVAVIPRLLGFEPADSLVIVGLAADHRVVVTFRYDLPPDLNARWPRELIEIADNAAGVLARERIPAVVLAGYGTSDPAEAAVRAAGWKLGRDGIDVLGAFRVNGGLYFDLDGGPAEGQPLDGSACPELPEGMASHPVAPSREAMSATIAGPSGDAAAPMLAALEAAAGRDRTVEDGLLHSIAVLNTWYAGSALTDDDIATLAVSMAEHMWVRDDLWARMQPGKARQHLAFWTEVVRRLPAVVAASASLLAFVAWQAGNGAFAAIAVERALDEDPGYSMADLLRRVLQDGLPPSSARLPLSVEAVAASYR